MPTNQPFWWMRIAAVLICAMAVGLNGTILNTSANAATKSLNAPDKIPTLASILMYHRIDDRDGCEADKGMQLYFSPEAVPKACVSKKRFEEQIKQMIGSKCEFITLTELYRRWQNGIKTTRKTVVITFDDGYGDNYRNAYPILKTYGIPATLFAITNKIDMSNQYITRKQYQKYKQNLPISPEFNDYLPVELLDQLAAFGQLVRIEGPNRYLTWKEIKALHADGWDIQSHTVNHERLPKAKNPDKELRDSKRMLEAQLKKKVEFLAYPYGAVNDTTVKKVRAAGYKMAVMIQSGRELKVADSIFKVRRITMLETSNDPTL